MTDVISLLLSGIAIVTGITMLLVAALPNTSGFVW